MKTACLGDLKIGDTFWLTPIMGGPGKVITRKSEFFVWVDTRGYSSRLTVYVKV